jgi:diguanylate cyclase (GGDEF)-like protein/PAS domain S-box-containing protein
METTMRSKLAIAITLWGWLYPISWLATRTVENESYDFDLNTSSVLLFAIPFVYTFLGYLVNEMGKTSRRLKQPAEDHRDVSQSVQLFKKALETMQLGVTITDLQGKIIYSNPADAEMHGYDVEEVEGKEVRIFAPSETWHPMPVETIRAMKRWRRESINIRKDGSGFPVMLMSDVVADAEGNAMGLITTCEDITPRKDFEKKIVNLAHYDILTSLPNRYLFHDRLTKAAEFSCRYGRTMAVLFIDLDHFKKINDNFGHSTGDQLLQRVAERLAKCVRASDSVARLSTDTAGSIVARFGGDEFTILLPEIAGREDLVKIARRILHSLSLPVSLGERELFVQASIGIALCPADGADVETLLKKADMAMFCAKESGRNSFHFYSDSMRDAKSKRYEIESDLRKALERNEFQLFYQPQIDIRTRKITGFEALLRWVQPGSVVVPPAAFIDIAEETGLIVPIGDWVIRNACEQVRTWLAAGFNSVAATVNISGIQLQQEGFVRTVSHILGEAGFDPRHLQLELTETAAMQRIAETLAKLVDLRTMGLGLSLDDFGTGYSSLNYLKRFPLTTLKIDQSFVRDLIHDDRTAAITKAIIMLGHGLNLTVIAEGVETVSQASFLCKHGCDGIQGFLICEPLDAVQTTEVLKEEDPFPHLLVIDH